MPPINLEWRWVGRNIIDLASVMKDLHDMDSPGGYVALQWTQEVYYGDEKDSITVPSVVLITMYQCWVGRKDVIVILVSTRHI